MAWFFLGDVPHTRRRGIVMRQRYLTNGEGVLAQAINASKYHDPDRELTTVKVVNSTPKTIMFEVWERNIGTPLDDICYTVFYINVPVSDELLEQACEADYGRGMRRNWPAEV